MSISSPQTESITQKADPVLLIPESPFQFLPTLAQIFGDTEALILQQLHYLLLKPYFAEERLKTTHYKGSLWVKVEMWMWWDDLEGICRHLTQRTFERKKSSLEASGVLLTTREINTDRQDPVRWFSINYSLLHDLSRAKIAEIEQLRAERDAERRALSVMYGPTEKWRPNKRIPELPQLVADPSRQNGGSPSPQQDDSSNEPSPSAKVAGVQPPEWREYSRQDGDSTAAKMATSTISTENSKDHSKDNNNRQGSSAAVDVSNSDELVSASEPLPFPGPPLTEKDGSGSLERAGAAETLEQIIDRLLRIRSGANANVLRKLVQANPAHAAMVANYFPRLNENDQAWVDKYNRENGKDLTRAKALVNRLKDYNWEPPEVRAAAIQEEKARTAIARKRVEEEARHLKARREAEEARQLHQAALDADRLYRSLPDETRTVVRDVAWASGNFLRDLTTKAVAAGTLPPAAAADPPSAALDGWTETQKSFDVFGNVIAQAMRDVAADRPELPGLEAVKASANAARLAAEQQRHMKEQEAKFLAGQAQALQNLNEALVERMVREIDDDVYALDEIDGQRERLMLGIDPSEDDEWGRLTAEVTRRIEQRRAA